MTARAAHAAPMAADPVRAYLDAIARVPLLTAVEEVDLGTRIEAGVLAEERLGSLGEKPDTVLARDLGILVRDGTRARDHLIAANLRLVVSIARRYSGAEVSLLDLVQEGNIGLMRAVEKFDHTRGYKFSTYATWWIRQAVGRARAEQGRLIRLPSNRAELLARLVRSRGRLAHTLGREPNAAELGDDLGVTAEVVGQLLDHVRAPLSLDRPVDEESSATVGDLIADVHATDPYELAVRAQRRRQVATVLDTLTDRESDIVRLRFGFVDGRPRTLTEIAVVLGVSRERVRQLEERTITRLRHPLRSRALRDLAE